MWPRRWIRVNARAGPPALSCARYHRSFSVTHQVVSPAATPIVSKPSRLAKAPVIRTLSPAKLTKTETLDISGKIQFVIHTPFGSALLPYYYNFRFPAGTHGFLYFASSHADPSIRFRIVDTGDPDEFKNGRDLLLPNAVTPWHVSKKTITKTKLGAALRRLLAHEGLGFCEDSNESTTQQPQSLDPARLTPLDTVTLMGRTAILHLPHGRVRLGYSDGRRVSFPERTRGFLYFDIASLSIRFRVVESTDFGKGDDLLLPDGQTTWCINLHRVASSTRYAPIRKQLLVENLIPERQMQSRAFVVSTLNHTRLTEADWMDLSGRPKTLISIAPADQERFTLAVYHGVSPIRFPSSAQGFLYWHVPEKNPYDAELRFRCAESLERFDQGHDLWTPGAKQPWSLRLRGLAPRRTSFSRSLVAYLIREGLTDESVVDHLAKTTVTHMRDLFFLHFGVFRNVPWSGVYDGAALARLVVLEDTPASFRLDIRVVTLLDGPRKVSDGKAWPDVDPPKEGELVFGFHVPKINPKHFWKTLRGATVPKSSKAGQVLKKIMEHSHGGDVDIQQV
ncbi:hypothetical protein BD626DRAFT_634238 [Schizophyllum amplum]|uniref:Uncharacterized protein n=1 Tax=Schizophyllum amplum TaxID=97359 RepID=A0A550C046_9AGAR|nr:hypothetical protein BD626DRAFT_634238 [Auriculariopsis ampla]